MTADRDDRIQCAGWNLDLDRPRRGERHDLQQRRISGKNRLRLSLARDRCVARGDAIFGLVECGERDHASFQRAVDSLRNRNSLRTFARRACAAQLSAALACWR